ncbi:MAG: helix-turn-helix domain-containing protein [Spirochaetaceae bacterium]|jgi:cytoskeletal protein RodZ|nr:helix-turn-helix domain-containing protein [Spirochaetaceae bacterium]
MAPIGPCRLLRDARSALIAAQEEDLVESLGVKLKNVRETKGYTIEQVCRDTNIASRYIEALENEEFAVFPGEPYLLGFLRNYGEYLGLDAEGLLAGYRALKIQEVPVPVEELLHSSPRIGKVIRIVGIVLAGLALGGGVFYYFWTRPAPAAAAPPEPRQAVEYELEGNSLERRLYRGDSVLVSLGPEQYKLELANLGETLTIAVPPDIQLMLDLGQEAGVDLNEDGRLDVRITAADFEKHNSAAGALLRFDMDYASADLESGETSFAGAGDAANLSAPGRGPETSAPVVVFTSPNSYPFTVQAAFQGYCMFRWEILAERDRRGRNERYFQRSDELSIQAQNGVRLWVSNAAAVRIQVIGGGRTVPLDIGGAGEVVVADIRWIRDEDGRFRLALLRLE